MLVQTLATALPLLAPLHPAIGGLDIAGRQNPIHHPPEDPPGEALLTSGVVTLHGADACVVLASDGTLRRVDLPTGVTTAVADEHYRSRSHQGEAGIFTRYEDPPFYSWDTVRGVSIAIGAIDEHRLATWNAAGPFYLRDASTLEPIRVLPVPACARIIAVSANGGRLALLDGTGRTEVLDPASPSKPIPIAGLPLQVQQGHRTGRSPIALSPSGATLASTWDGRLAVFDCKSGAEVLDVPLADFEFDVPAPGPFGMSEDDVVSERADVDALTYYGEDRILVGWSAENSDGDYGPLGVDLLRLVDGERVARLLPHWLWGGSVCDLRGDPALGMVAITTGASGLAAAFGGEDWSERWRIDFGGGNPHGLWIRRAEGSDRFCLSGMKFENPRVLDARTGKVLASSPPLEGIDLGGTTSGAYVVCRNDDKLDVFDGRTFDRLYRRGELTGGLAWIEREGAPRKLVVSPESTSPESPKQGEETDSGHDH